MLERPRPIPTLSVFQHDASSPSPLAGWEGFVPFPPCVCFCATVCIFLPPPLSKPCPGVFTCSQLERWAMFYSMGPPCLLADFLWDSPARECHGGLADRSILASAAGP